MPRKTGTYERSTVAGEFVYAFVRKEAVLSAQIEGTQATLMDLLEVEAVQVLEAADIVRPLDERKKNRVVVFEDYLAHLREGTEL